MIDRPSSYDTPEGQDIVWDIVIYPWLREHRDDRRVKSLGLCSATVLRDLAHKIGLALDRAVGAERKWEAEQKTKTEPCFCGICDENGPVVCPSHGPWGWEDSTGNVQWFARKDAITGEILPEGGMRCEIPTKP